MRSLAQKLELRTYANDKLVTFQMTTSAGIAVDSVVGVPLPIIFRYYHLGRAYDLHQLKNLHPTGTVSLDYIALQLLIGELEQVAALVADPVIQAYNATLLPILKSGLTDKTSRLFIKPP